MISLALAFVLAVQDGDLRVLARDADGYGDPVHTGGCLNFLYNFLNLPSPH